MPFKEIQDIVQPISREGMAFILISCTIVLIIATGIAIGVIFMQCSGSPLPSTEIVPYRIDINNGYPGDSYFATDYTIDPHGNLVLNGDYFKERHYCQGKCRFVEDGYKVFPAGIYTVTRR